jgi:hypothetical protein
MAKKSKFPLIGVTLATPALMTVGVSHASVAPTSPLKQSSVAASASIIAAQARLKAELLSLGREEKLRIAGDRVRLPRDQPVTQLARTAQTVTCGGCIATTACRGGAHAHAPQRANHAIYTAGCRHLTPTHTIDGKANNAPRPTSISDIRLKRNIVKLAHLDNGLSLYRFRYTWGDTVYVGVMAQEVLAIFPDAVVHDPDGYMRVNYERLGLRMMTWAEWVGSQDGHSQRAA